MLAPGLGILLAILAIPVFLVLARQESVSKPAPPSVQATRSVAAVIGIIVAAGVAGFISFFAACVAGGIAGYAGGTALAAHGSPAGEIWAIGLALTLGPLAGITIFVLILRKLWRPVAPTKEG